jgi:hypothetical protein
VVPASCEDDSETSGLITSTELGDQVRDYQLFTKNFALCNQADICSGTGRRTNMSSATQQWLMWVYESPNEWAGTLLAFPNITIIENKPGWSHTTLQDDQLEQSRMITHNTPGWSTRTSQDDHTENSRMINWNKPGWSYRTLQDDDQLEKSKMITHNTPGWSTRKIQDDHTEHSRMIN